MFAGFYRNVRGLIGRGRNEESGCDRPIGFNKDATLRKAPARHGRISQSFVCIYGRRIAGSARESSPRVGTE